MFLGKMSSETKQQTLEENEFYTAHLKSMNTPNVLKNDCMETNYSTFLEMQNLMCSLSEMHHYD